MAYFNNLIGLISGFYPTLLWKKTNKEKIIYLTFDDGPVPGVTDFVLEQLEIYKAKATFFCVGENIKKNPAHLGRIISRGHAFGNHTFNHLKGWNTEDATYLENVKLCQDEIRKVVDYLPAVPSLTYNRKLFRPPYGKIKKSQIKALSGQYEIVMWNVLTGDFDGKQTPEACLRQAIKHTKAGSIVIFHDSLKAEKSLQYALPKFLEHFISGGYRFETL